MCIFISSTNINIELVERIPRARAEVVRIPLAISRECEGVGDEMRWDELNLNYIENLNLYPLIVVVVTIGGNNQSPLISVSLHTPCN